ncbi:MAG: hypothetical protein JO006_15470 [Paucibacter sp.]|nr:hypothetical protein [Roseateles sp.]
MPQPFRLLLPLLLVCATALAQAAAPALVTISQGEATLLRDDTRFKLAEGVALKADDIIELGPQALLLRIEYADGSSLLLGPGSRVLVLPKLLAERSKARAYLLAGWAKFSLAPDAEGMLASGLVDLSGKGSRGVLGLSNNRAQVFAEGGEWKLRYGAGSVAMKGGDFVTVPATGKPETAGRPSPEFIQALPRAFMDTLPPRAQLFAGKDVPLKSVGTLGYADVRDWLTLPEPAVRRAELARWKSLAREAEFRAALIENLKSHPEWDPILFPSLPASARAASKP